MNQVDDECVDHVGSSSSHNAPRRKRRIGIAAIIALGGLGVYAVAVGIAYAIKQKSNKRDTKLVGGESVAQTPEAQHPIVSPTTRTSNPAATPLGSQPSLRPTAATVAALVTEGPTLLVTEQDSDLSSPSPSITLEMDLPTRSPSNPRPSAAPTIGPTLFPTLGPTTQPSLEPSLAPTPGQPTASPSYPETAIPTPAPTFRWTLWPTWTLTLKPTPNPTVEGATPPPTNAPTPFPTRPPTPMPTVVQPTVDVSPLRNILQQITFDDLTTQEAVGTMQWVTENSEAGASAERLIQRYALMRLDFATQVGRSPRFIPPLTEWNECSWRGISCFVNTTTVDRIVWSESGLTGTIPDDLALLTRLSHLDLAENSLYGEIPSSLYELANLQYLYLFSNSLSGRLSSAGMTKLFNLVHVYLGDNQLTGPFPPGFGSPSREFIRPLTKIQLYNNALTGTIPSNLNLRNLFYLDLGRNYMRGTLPRDWYTGESFMRDLRHMLLDHNSFSGTLPQGLTRIGSGRCSQMELNDNEFTGEFPGGFSPTTFLETMDIQRTNVTSIHQDVCNMFVLSGEGEIVHFRADCAACTCDWQVCQLPTCTL